MSGNTVDISKEDVIVGLAKGVGLSAPDTYTKEFGNSVLQAMAAKLDEHLASVPVILTQGQEEYARNSFIEEITRNIGLPVNDQNKEIVNSMISEAGDAVTGLNKNVDAGVVISLKAPAAVSSQAPEMRTETQMVTKSVPDRELSDATKADIKEVQTLLSGAIGRTNQLREVNIIGPMLGLDKPLENIGQISDSWSESSLSSVNAVIDLLKEKNGLSDQFPESGYTPELGKALQQKMEELKNTSFLSDPTASTKLAALNQILPEDQRVQLFAALDRLSAANEMRPVTMVSRQVEVEVEVPVPVASTVAPQTPSVASQPVTQSPASKPSETSEDNIGDVKTQHENTTPEGGNVPSSPAIDMAAIERRTAITAVESVLLQIGGHLDKMPGMGMISQFGLIDKVITPLTEEDIKDGVFGDNSQDLASKLIMGLKMLDGQKNVTGEYNHAVGENLRVSILTKPEFQFIRDQLKSDDGTPLRFFGAGGGALTGATAADQQKLARKLLTFDENKIDEPAADAPEELKAKYRDQVKFEKEHEEDLQSVRKLNAFFAGMDTLQKQGLYDNEKAKQTNKNNLMLDAASAMLDQWDPGIKTWLKDFFTNSQFGQMISGVLSQFFGINVGRLWGDKDDGAALERSKPLIESSFSDFYKDAKDDLGAGATHKEVMAKVKEDIMDKTDGFKFKAAMKILFKGQDENVVKDAIEKALDAAQNSTDLTSAQNAFSQSLLVSGNKYRNGQDLSDNEIAQINSYLKDTSKDIQGVVGAPLVPSASPDNTSDADSKIGITSYQDSSNDIASVLASVDARDPSAPAVDADVIKAGEKNIELLYTPNDDEWIQGATRYSHGRVDDIQAVLGDNADKLGLSLNADGMKNADGNYSDMLTPYTNAVIEETLIRAQIHELQEQGVVITQEHLDGFDRKLTTENLHTFTSYLEDKGVSAAEVAKLSEAIIGADGKGLGTDYYSTDPNDRAAGERQDYSVLEQSHFGNQFDLKVAQWVPAAAIETDLTNEDPLRDRYLEYNKDRPCEVPMFFKKEGSDSVFALIRDKNGNDDPSDDKFKELEFDNYLLTHRIQDAQAPELKAVLDNYNWENPTDRGVRDVINKVLGIEPRSINIDMPVQKIETKAEAKVDNGCFEPEDNTRAQEHKRPEVFRDLRTVTLEQANYITDKLGLRDNEALMDMAKRDRMHPLEVFFEQQIRSSNSQKNNAIFLELEANGMKKEGIDVLIAIRNNDPRSKDYGNLEFRYVDYETDAIRPLSEQRAGKTDISEKFDVNSHVNGQRRLDDFMDEIDRKQGIYSNRGPSNGYLGMSAIVPSDSGFRAINAFTAVYKPADLRESIMLQKDYLGATVDRYAERSSYDVEKGVRDYQSDVSGGSRAFGIPEADKKLLDDMVSNNFNKKSDADTDASSRIGQNMRDMDADIADAAIQQQQADISHSHSMGR